MNEQGLHYDRLSLVMVEFEKAIYSLCCIGFIVNNTTILGTLITLSFDVQESYTIKNKLLICKI